MNRRLAIFLAVAFGLTWSAWGSLALLVRAQMLVYGEWRFMVLFVIGGLGPTIAAYVAVIATRQQAPLSEFHRRLLRWRVAPRWYLAATLLPVALALMAVGIAVLLRPSVYATLSLRPWYMILPLFFAMVIGGGLEEFGWRGIAQEELQRSFGPARTSLMVGPIWAIWHLPLFFLAGTSQYGSSFPVFAIGVIGMALMLGWLYSHTTSILLCVVFHAMANAISAQGLVVSHENGWLVLLGPGVMVLLGCLLLLAVPARAPGANQMQHARSAN